MNKKLLAAIDEVYREIMAMTKEEFYKKIGDHEEGDVARFLIETNAFEAEDVICQSFEGNNWKTETISKTFSMKETACCLSGNFYSSSLIGTIGARIIENDKEKDDDKCNLLAMAA